MPIAIISSVEADGRAPVVLKLSADSRIRGGTRRLSRTATLDGGSVIVDHGYSDADRTFTLKVTGLGRDEVSALEAMSKGLPALTVAVEDGVYQGKVQQILSDNGDVDISFLVARRL